MAVLRMCPSGEPLNNQDPKATDFTGKSAGWDEVPRKRPKFVIPAFGPMVDDAIAAGEEIEIRMAKSPEFVILADEALPSHSRVPLKSPAWATLPGSGTRDW